MVRRRFRRIELSHPRPGPSYHLAALHEQRDLTFMSIHCLGQDLDFLGHHLPLPIHTFTFVGSVDVQFDNPPTCDECN